MTFRMNETTQSIETIYLAGKIEKHDWRHDIVDELEGKSLLRGDGGGIHQGAFSQWPIMDKAIFGEFNYSGPYFVSGEHFSFHGEGTHGVGADELPSGDLLPKTQHAYIENTGGHGSGYPEGLSYATVVDRCQHAIGRSDLIFAWIDDITCYGTIAEIGYAKALGKIVWIAGPRSYRDLVFVYEMVDGTLFNQGSTAHDLLRALLTEYRRRNPRFNSPIEKKFWDAWSNNALGAHYSIYPLMPQHPVGKYRVDFAHIRTKTAIELDGLASHSSTEDIANDRRRQREIEAMGWTFIRFGGKEIHHDALKCIQETYALISRKSSAEFQRIRVVRESTDIKTTGSQLSPSQQNKQKFHPDDKVTHSMFGDGIVLVSEMLLDDEFVEVQFQNEKFGKKRLSTNLAKLDRLPQ